jgi:hypothetical protein
MTEMTRPEAIAFLQSIAPRMRADDKQAAFFGSVAEGDRCRAAFSALGIGVSGDSVLVKTSGNVGDLTVLADLGIAFPGSERFKTQTEMSNVDPVSEMQGPQQRYQRFSGLTIEKQEKHLDGDLGINIQIR